MIPASAYTPLLRITFGMIALRRGPHWNLQSVPAEATPFGESLDEAELLSEAIAGVMKHVPLPTRELGIVSDLTTAAIAFYAVLTPRIELDRQVALARSQGREVRFVLPGQPPPTTSPTSGPDVQFPHSEDDIQNNGDVDAGTILEGLGDEPVRAKVEHTVEGVPVQLGHSVTASLGDEENPEPALLHAFRPGEQAATAEQLAAMNESDSPLLDRLAPVPEVDGVPVERELE